MDNTDGAPQGTEQTTLVRIASTRPPLWERHPALTGGLLTLVAAAVAGAIGYGGAQAGAKASLDVATMQMQAENARRAQDNRDVVYKEYLAAASRYFHAWDDLPTRENPEPIATVPAQVKEFLIARAEYQGQINEVHVHGSQTARKASRKVAATMPHSLGGSDMPSGDEVPDATAFRAAFNVFLDVRCAEVNPDSAGFCDTP